MTYNGIIESMLLNKLPNLLKNRKMCCRGIFVIIISLIIGILSFFYVYNITNLNAKSKDVVEEEVVEDYKFNTVYSSTDEQFVSQPEVKNPMTSIPTPIPTQINTDNNTEALAVDDDNSSLDVNLSGRIQVEITTPTPTPIPPSPTPTPLLPFEVNISVKQSDINEDVDYFLVSTNQNLELCYSWDDTELDPRPLGKKDSYITFGGRCEVKRDYEKPYFYIYLLNSDRNQDAWIPIHFPSLENAPWLDNWDSYHCYDNQTIHIRGNYDWSYRCTFYK